MDVKAIKFKKIEPPRLSRDGIRAWLNEISAKRYVILEDAVPGSWKESTFRDIFLCIMDRVDFKPDIEDLGARKELLRKLSISGSLTPEIVTGHISPTLLKKLEDRIVFANNEFLGIPNPEPKPEPVLAAEPKKLADLKKLSLKEMERLVDFILALDNFSDIRPPHWSAALSAILHRIDFEPNIGSLANLSRLDQEPDGSFIAPSYSELISHHFSEATACQLLEIIEREHSSLHGAHLVDTHFGTKLSKLHTPVWMIEDESAEDSSSREALDTQCQWPLSKGPDGQLYTAQKKPTEPDYDTDWATW